MRARDNATHGTTSLVHSKGPPKRRRRSETVEFDAFLAGKANLTSDEMTGYKLFDGKAACNTYHLDGRESTQTPGLRIF
jgi:hypothetical protein